MKLHFDPHQDFQIQAIQSVVDLFEGQPLNKGDFEFSLTEKDYSLQLNENGFGNKLLITDEQILDNLTKGSMKDEDLHKKEDMKIK